MSSLLHITRSNLRSHWGTRFCFYRTLTTMTTPNIVLTPSEALVRKCLLDCRDAMRQTVPGMADLELRFAGGWVRDKLLGSQSHDIDVALSTMTGEQFGEALKTFMRDHEQTYLNEAQANGIPAIIKGLHKIEKNPELSKHLETVTTRMFGLDMDFVNLRKEVYDEVSRNPIMEFGTPQEDAMRRDATVNALFYHLDSNQVEDFTGKGLQDMQDRIIRTPLEPYQTFKDDPLRVLRLIRFASRLGYQIDASAYEAMRDERIHRALRIKISRERVGVEVLKIMGGPDPLRGLNYIFDRGLYAVVFADPSSDAYPDFTQIPQIYEGLQSILNQESIIPQHLRPGDDKTLSWFLASYVPWKDLQAGAVRAAKEGIKAANTLSKVFGDAIKSREGLLKCIKDVNNGQAIRSVVGIALKNAGGSWRNHVLYSLLCDMANEGPNAPQPRYEKFLKYLENQNLLEADKIRPILNGNEIKQAMQITQAGPWLKRAIDAVVEWQFDNPSGTVQDAQAMLLNRQQELQQG